MYPLQHTLVSKISQKHLPKTHIPNESHFSHLTENRQGEGQVITKSEEDVPCKLCVTVPVSFCWTRAGSSIPANKMLFPKGECFNIQIHTKGAVFPHAASPGCHCLFCYSYSWALSSTTHPVCCLELGFWVWLCWMCESQSPRSEQQREQPPAQEVDQCNGSQKELSS